jgi:chromosome segregation ATPase
MTKSNLKIAIDPVRAELRDSIAEVDATQKAADAAQQSVELASAKLRAAQTAHGRAETALEEATSPPMTLDQKLKFAESVDEMLEIADAHPATLRREPLTAARLKQLRQAIEEASDALIIAKQTHEAAEHDARPTAAALRRAVERRTKAVHELARPEVGRLMHEVQAIIEQLLAKRAALSFVSSTLTDPYSSERRRAHNFLNLMSFPEEGGLRTATDLTLRDSAVAAWQNFAAQITQNANTPLP